MSSKEDTAGSKAQLVVLGSGGGLVAAVTAAEAGVKDIIVVEKQGVPGGNTKLANGFFACESPVLERAGITAGRDEYFRIAMKWNQCRRINPRVLRAFIDESGKTVRWLEEKGVEFEPKTPGAEPHATSHTPVGLGRRLMEVITARAGELGVNIMLRTSGRRIVRDSRGRVTGVIVERNGEELSIETGCVIIATGGFPGNTELLRKYCPDFHDGMYLGRWPYHTGDGLLMAEAAGAAIAPSIPIFHIGPVPETGGWGGLAHIVREPYTMWVNKRGIRFIDEAGHSPWENGNAITMQPEAAMYVLFDDALRVKIEDKGLLTSRGWGQTPWKTEEELANPDSQVRALVAKGQVKQFDSWEEMAEWIGAAPATLQATVDEYNQACDLAHDPVFAKNPEHLLPLRRPPYYAVRGYVHTGETMGGIIVTERMEVRDTGEKVIPGLYAASVLADGWAGQTYCSDGMGGSAFGFALNSGRIAGASAAGFILGK